MAKARMEEAGEPRDGGLSFPPPNPHTGKPEIFPVRPHLQSIQDRTAQEAEKKMVDTRRSSDHCSIKASRVSGDFSTRQMEKVLVVGGEWKAWGGCLEKPWSDGLACFRT